MALVTKSDSSSGFSVLELVVAIAIMSLATAALFQSTTQWMRLAAKSATTADKAVGTVSDQLMFKELVRGLTFSWPERTTEIFNGGPSGFTGLSKSSLHGIEPRLALVSLAVKPMENGDKAIFYEAGDVVWPLKDLGANNASFSYLGADGDWRSQWPPRTNPEPGPFRDAQYFATPQLPLAIKVTMDGSDGTPSRRTVWIADLPTHPDIPTRVQDITANGGANRP